MNKNKVIIPIRNADSNLRFLQDNLLRDAGVATISGTSFGKFGEGYVRFSFANSSKNIKILTFRYIIRIIYYIIIVQFVFII